MPEAFSPALQTFLQRFENVSHSKSRIAVFDCDGTVIKGDIGEAMFYFQIERFLLRVNPANIWPDHPKREELDNLYSGLSALQPDRRILDRRFLSFSELMVGWYFDQLTEGKTEKACTDIVRLLSKFSEEEVRNIASSTFKEELASPITVRKFGKHSVPKGIRYIKETIAILKELQRLQFDIWGISGSNLWSVQPVFEQLGIPRDHIIGIELQPSNNILTSRVQTPVPVLEGKVAALRQFTSVEPVIVVSDSIYDLPLFNYSSKLRVLVNSRMETSYTFFKQAKITQDASWVVIEKPTVE